MKHNVITSISGLLLGSSLLLAGCASNPASQEAVADGGSVAMKELEPASPVADTAAAEATTTAAATPAAAPAAEVKTSGIDSVLKRLSNNRLTLYWRDKGAYTFYVGGIVAAEYKPGTGITLSEPGAEDAFECNFAESGTLKSPADPAKKDSCNKLMFTLDHELGE